MRKLSVFLVCMLTGGLLLFDAHAQDPGAGVIFFQHRQFNIPFKNDLKINIAQVRLYVSNDQGRTWQFTATAAPEEQHFRFSTAQDGYYCFAVQTVDTQGKLYPPNADDLRPNLRVIVDSTPPTVQAQPLPNRGGEVGVSWTVRDDNLDLSLPDAVQLQYRLAGGVTWNAIPFPPGSNQHYWNPRTNGAVEVRVLARDRAGNVGEDKTIVSLSGVTSNPSPYLSNPGTAPDAYGSGKEPDRKYVKTREITLGFDLNEVGPSGVSAVELWYTLWNARAWNKLNEFAIDMRPGEMAKAKKLTFKVEEEGVYGITLVAKSGVGLGDQPPRVGERPQFWIEVDLTKPDVQVQNIIVGRGPDKGRLTVAWTARDKNLGPNPIRISFAEQKEGPWNLCADKLPNSGRYVWRMPDPLPYQFFLKVEATDLAGNIGEATTPEKVKVDLSLPKASIRTVEPGTK